MVSSFVVFRNFCEWARVSLHLGAFPESFLWLFSFLLLMSYYWLLFVLSNFIYFEFFLDACLYSSEREKEGGFGWVGIGKDLGGAGGKETIIRTYCTEKNVFSV